MEQQIDALQKKIGCEGATVWLKEGDIIFPYIFFGDNVEGLENLELKSTEGMAGHCVTNNEEIISNKALQDSDVAASVDKLTGFSTKNIICLPITVLGEVYGCVQLLNKKNGEFNEDDLAIARKIVNMIEANL